MFSIVRDLYSRDVEIEAANLLLHDNVMFCTIKIKAITARPVEKSHINWQKKTMQYFSFTPTWKRQPYMGTGKKHFDKTISFSVQNGKLKSFSDTIFKNGMSTLHSFNTVIKNASSTKCIKSFFFLLFNNLLTQNYKFVHKFVLNLFCSF